jgi:hypothetical protein
MKNITILLFICFICTSCSAQTRLTPGELKGKHDSFIVEKYPKPFDTIKNIGVSSKKNKYNKGIPYSAAEKARNFVPMSHLDIHVDNAAVKQIVYDVLSNKLTAAACPSVPP